MKKFKEFRELLEAKRSDKDASKQLERTITKEFGLTEEGQSRLQTGGP
jgi:hypothetical protein